MLVGLADSQDAPGGVPMRIAAGDDGSIWLTYFAPNQNKIGRVRPDLTYTDYHLRTPLSGPYEITNGPDGAMWFTEPGRNAIGRITPDGICSHIPLSSPASALFGIAAGHDGAIWFAENNTNRIMRTTVSGRVEQVAQLTTSGGPWHIAPGLNGIMWFTAGSDAARLHSIRPDGHVDFYELPRNGTVVGDIAVAPDGAVWFTEPRDDQIGRMIADVSIVEMVVPTPDARPIGITYGPDGAIWFTESGAGKIGRITTDGQITEFELPGPDNDPSDIVAGRDGALWFNYHTAPRVGRITLDGSIVTYGPEFLGAGESRDCIEESTTAEHPQRPRSGSVAVGTRERVTNG
ncbi:MAG TPA: Virginiamycin B lyase [Chloroflexota bacterium]